MDKIETMSTNIADLNGNNMKQLSNNIANEIDTGMSGTYMEPAQVNNLQEMQLQQLQQLKQMQELQLMQEHLNKKSNKQEQVDSDSEIDTNNKKKKKSSYLGMIKESLVVLVLYLLISHPIVHKLLGKFIPNLASSEDGVSIINLLVRGGILTIVLFLLKIFLFKN